MTQSVLDFSRPSYPEAAGYKPSAPETSREAARGIDATLLRGKVLAAMQDNGPMTADECAELLGSSILSIRPRFSELKRMGEIADTGTRRPNASGRTAAVWASKEFWRYAIGQTPAGKAPISSAQPASAGMCAG
jgi:hypothetical protein